MAINLNISFCKCIFICNCRYGVCGDCRMCIDVHLYSVSDLDKTMNDLVKISWCFVVV